MSCSIFPAPAVAGIDFEFFARYDDDNGVLIDLTGSEALLVGRSSIQSEESLFSFDETDGVIEFGSFTANDQEHNIKVVIPHTTTQELNDIHSFFLGLRITPPSSSPIAIIQAEKVSVSPSVAL